MRAIKNQGAVLVANCACMLVVVQLLALTPAALAQDQPGEACHFETLGNSEYRSAHVNPRPRTCLTISGVSYRAQARSAAR